jgi:two-component system LytT family response regulator
MGDDYHLYSHPMNPLRRALIIDDEHDSRASLRRLLAAHPEVKIVGEADSVTEALRLFQSLTPDLIFLDVQMPGGSGFNLLPRLQPLPSIIFVTAYDVYAVRAFDVNAVDYLMKPIREDRLANAINRLSLPQHRRKIGPFFHDDQIILNTGNSMRCMFVKHINCIKALGNYSEVHVADVGVMTVRRKMSEWKRALPSPVFLPLDRSLIINRESLRGTSKLSRARLKIEFAGSRESISLGYMASVRLRMALRSKLSA